MQLKQFERDFFEAFRDSTILNYVVNEPKVLMPLVKDTVCSTLFTADWMFKK